MRILVVEDDHDFRLTLTEELSPRYAVDACGRGNEALDLLELNPYDLVILDIGLPDVSGVYVCSAARAQGLTMPILMLTGLSNVDDKVIALEAGADDYLTKPVDSKELLVRLQVLLRRASYNTFNGSELKIDDLVLNPSLRTVLHKGKNIVLRRKEFDLLEFLLRCQPEVVTREMILDHVWDQNVNSFTNVVDVHVSRLRTAINTPFGTNLIETVHGLGYRIVPTIMVDPPSIHSGSHYSKRKEVLMHEHSS